MNEYCARIDDTRDMYHIVELWFSSVQNPSCACDDDDRSAMSLKYLSYCAQKYEALHRDPIDMRLTLREPNKRWPSEPWCPRSLRDHYVLRRLCPKRLFEFLGREQAFRVRVLVTTLDGLSGKGSDRGKQAEYQEKRAHFGMISN
jgi:hypothetical protein